MVAFLAILLYISGGHAVLEQKLFPTQAECVTYVAKRAEELALDIHVNLLIDGGCATVEATKAKVL